MTGSRKFLFWSTRHILLFFASPFSFALAGLMIGLLASATAERFSEAPASRATSLRLVEQIFIWMAPFLAGVLLGAAVGVLQMILLRKLDFKIHAGRWVFSSAFGFGLAFFALDWAINRSYLVTPLPFASLFCGAVYGLTAGLPQSRLWNPPPSNRWVWLIASALAGGLSFGMISASTWLPDPAAVLWLIFLLNTAGGMVYAAVTGLGILLLRRAPTNWQPIPPV